MNIAGRNHRASRGKSIGQYGAFFCAFLCLVTICAVAHAQADQTAQKAGRIKSFYEKEGTRFLEVDLYELYGEEAAEAYKKVHPEFDPDFEDPPSYYSNPLDLTITTLPLAENAVFHIEQYDPAFQDQTLTWPQFQELLKKNISSTSGRTYNDTDWWLKINKNIVTEVREVYFP